MNTFEANKKHTILKLIRYKDYTVLIILFEILKYVNKKKLIGCTNLDYFYITLYQLIIFFVTYVLEILDTYT